MTRLRRRGRLVLTTVLPAVLIGWIGAAGPCVGMAAAPAAASGAVEQHAAPPAHDAHGHGGAGHAAEAAAAGERSGAHAHGACPHCPGTDGAASDTHALCAAVDDVSDFKRKPAAPGLDLVKAALPAAIGAGALPAAAASRARRPELYHRAFPPAVPLNVRHCVFIV